MKNILLKIKEEFITEPLKFHLSRRKSSSLVLMFHFNQSFSDYFDTASEVCYIPFLELLDKYNIKFSINFSHTFLEGARENQKLLSLVNRISEKKNIKLVESIASQSMACILDKDVQMMTIPKSEKKNSLFWIPERTYDKEFIEELENKGYKYVFLEKFYRDKEPLVKFKNLHILPDSVRSRHLIDGFLLNGRNKYKVRNYILSNNLTVFAEDAEVSSLWSYEKEEDFVRVLERMREFLDWISKEKRVETVFPEEINTEFNLVENIEDLNVKKQCASWISDIFDGYINVFYEKGFDSFWDYIKGSKISFFKENIEDFVRRINNLEVNEKLKQGLLKIIFFHMYEFGCPGVGFEDRELWGGIFKVEKYIIALEKWGNALKSNDKIDHFEYASSYIKARSFIVVKKNEYIYIFDNYSQLVSIVNLKEGKFDHNELFIELNGFIDSRLSAIDFKSDIFEKSDFFVKEEKLFFENKNEKSFYEFEGEKIVKTYE